MAASRTACFSHLVSPHLRSHAPFLPFLYCTPTILNASRAINRPNQPVRRQSSQSELAEDNSDRDSVDQEPSSQPLNTWASHILPDGPKASASHQTHTPTITRREREAFEKLLSQTETTTLSTGSITNVEKTQASEQVPGVLDSIMQGAIEAKEAKSRNALGTGPRYQWPQSLQTIAKEIHARQRAQEHKKEVQFLTKADLIRKREFERVEKLMLDAKTDTELWNVLETEIFPVIAALGLRSDEQKSQEGPSESEHDRQATFIDFTTTTPIRGSDLAVLAPTCASILVVAARQLRHEFPASSLPLAILPAIKALGRESFMLGASTMLYNELIVLTWLRYADFQTISDMLSEMDNGAVDFDHETLEVLDSIQQQMHRASRGAYGSAFKAVWEMDMFRRGMQKLTRWRQLIRSRIEAEALRKARESGKYAST